MTWPVRLATSRLFYRSDEVGAESSWHNTSLAYACELFFVHPELEEKGITITSTVIYDEKEVGTLPLPPLIPFFYQMPGFDGLS